MSGSIGITVAQGSDDKLIPWTKEFQIGLEHIQENSDSDTIEFGSTLQPRYELRYSNQVDSFEIIKIRIIAMFNSVDTVTTDYDDFVGDLGFQDIVDGNTLFVNEANDDYNLQSGSDAKNSGPFLTNRGAMSDAEAAGAGGGQSVIGGSVVR